MKREFVEADGIEIAYVNPLCVVAAYCFEGKNYIDFPNGETYEVTEKSYRRIVGWLDDETGEYDAESIEAENAKLRQLARDLYEFADIADSVTDLTWTQMRVRMRELGIVVDQAGNHGV